jgi:GNAT superfamily N-acetyltransferase
VAEFAPGQFQYLIKHVPGGRYSRSHTTVKAFHPETGTEVGLLSTQGPMPGKVTQARPGSGQLFSFGDKPQPRAQVKGAYVHPDYQRQGIGRAMFHISHQFHGVAPMHDTVVTPAAQGWAAKVGGALHPEMNRSFGEDAQPLDYTKEELRGIFARHHTQSVSEAKSEGYTQAHPWGVPSKRGKTSR